VPLLEAFIITSLVISVKRRRLAKAARREEAAASALALETANGVGNSADGLANASDAMQCSIPGPLSSELQTELAEGQDSGL
jgi:hypothetical protein